MGGEERYIQSWCGNLRERDHLADISINGSIILNWIFKKSDGGRGLD
jgi:hypothetical protein